MASLRDTGRVHRERFRTLAGAHFMGHLSAAPDAQGRVNTLVTPRRALTVHPNCEIQPGTLFYSTSGEVMLTAVDGISTTRGAYSKTLKVYLLDRNMSWHRKSVVTDAVTGEDRGTEDLDLGKIWGTFEVIGSDSDTLHMPLSRYRVVTNSMLQIGDTLDNTYTVRRVETALGIIIAEVE